MENRNPFFDRLGELYSLLGEVLLANLLWLVCSLPLLTIPPALAGLYWATNQLAHEKPVTWRVFFQGFRDHFWRSWRWALLNLFVLAVLVSNFYFYERFAGGWVVWLRGGFIALGALWLLLQVYTFPLLLEQQDRRLLVALRNSTVLFLRWPGLAVGMALAVLLLAYLTTFYAWPAWLVITPALGTYLANWTVLQILAQIAPAGSQEAEE